MSADKSSTVFSDLCYCFFHQKISQTPKSFESYILMKVTWRNPCLYCYNVSYHVNQMVSILIKNIKYRSLFYTCEQERFRATSIIYLHPPTSTFWLYKFYTKNIPVKCKKLKYISSFVFIFLFVFFRKLTSSLWYAINSNF